MAVIDSSYAKEDKLTTSSKISVGGTSFKVIGIAKEPQGGGPANDQSRWPAPRRWPA